MIEAITMYTVICDRCGSDVNEDTDYSCWNSPGIARERADADDCKEIGDKDYCPNCYYLDEETDEYCVKLQEAK